MFTSFHLNGRLCSSDLIRHIAAEAKTPYTFLITKPDIEWVYRAQERMLQVLQMTHAKMVYADHFQRTANSTKKSPHSKHPSLTTNSALSATISTSEQSCSGTPTPYEKQPRA